MSPKYINYAEKIIEAIAIRYEAEFKEISIKQWVKELEHLSKDELNKAFQRFKREYENLPFRFAVSEGLLKQLKPTITAATVEERLYASLSDKDPCGFLDKINPKLRHLAFQGGIFDRQLTAADQNFRIKDVAKRFLEWQQNEAKGFQQAEPEAENKALVFEFEELPRVQNPFKGLPLAEAAKLAAVKLAEGHRRQREENEAKACQKKN